MAGFRTKETYFDNWAEAVTMAVVPKFSAIMSLLGSGCIMREVWADHKNNKSSTVKRILFGMSCTDLCMSGAWFFTTWPSPVETPVAFAVGNTQTCVAQATFLQFGNCATPIYNGSLAIAYLLKVKYNIPERTLRKYELWFHLPPLLIAGGTTLASIPMTLFNNNLYVCWIAEYPLGCNQSYNHPPEERNCIRGDNATIYSYAFLNFWIWSAYVVIIVSMSMMYMHVRAVERKSATYNFRRNSTQADPETQERRKSGMEGGAAGIVRRASLIVTGGDRQAEAQLKKTKAMANQAGWYIGAFFITMMPDTISIALLASISYYNFWLHLVAYIFNPMQGYFNFLVFARSRVQMEGYVSTWLRKVSFCECFPYCRKKADEKLSQAASARSGRRRSLGFHGSVSKKSDTRSSFSVLPVALRRLSLASVRSSHVRQSEGDGNLDPDDFKAIQIAAGGGAMTNDLDEPEPSDEKLPSGNARANDLDEPEPSNGKLPRLAEGEPVENGLDEPEQSNGKLSTPQDEHTKTIQTENDEEEQ